MEEFFLVARIIKLNAEDGSLKVRLITDFPENFRKQKFFFAEFQREYKKLFIEKIVLTKNGCVVKFKDFNDNEKAELLIGKELFIENAQLAKLKEFQFYEHDLIGSAVLLNETSIGTIKEIMRMPANDVIAIETTDGKELLIPFIKNIFLSFDVETKVLRIGTDENFFEEVN